MHYVLGVDIGTASSKAVLTTVTGEVVARASRPHITVFPQPGWAEHDAESLWWADFHALTAEILASSPHRPDAVCVRHTHTPAGVAVSAQREGLLPVSQQATVALASLGYHDYEGIAVRDDEKPRLQRDLGDNTCLILRNHGLLTVGATVADAFLSMYLLQRACEIQLLAQATGKELVSVDPRIVGGVKANVAAVTRGLGGTLAWPGLLRKLDRLSPGYAE